MIKNILGFIRLFMYPINRRMKYIIFLILLLSPKAAAINIKSDSGKHDVKTNKVVRITGSITDESAYRFESQMLLTAALPGPRVVLINSPGGSVRAGNRMIKELEEERSAGVKVICFVEKRAVSMAFNLLTHCDVRLSVVKGSLLFHPVAETIINCTDDERCTPKRLREEANRLEEEDRPFRTANANALGMSLTEYDVHSVNETWWTTITLLVKGYIHDTAEIIP